ISPNVIFNSVILFIIKVLYAVNVICFIFYEKGFIPYFALLNLSNKPDENKTNSTLHAFSLLYSSRFRTE
ncbi:hypothetical protein LEA_06256, partial [human gut metagenome]